MMGNNLFLGMGIVAFAAIISALGALFFKFTSKHLDSGLSNLLKKPTLYLGFLFYGLAALLFVFSLKFGDLSALNLVSGLNYVWISLFSVKFLKEKMTDVKWFGIVLIIIGVAFIGLSA